MEKLTIGELAILRDLFDMGYTAIHVQSQENSWLPSVVRAKTKELEALENKIRAAFDTPLRS
jgi:hypothetical protein